MWIGSIFDKLKKTRTGKLYTNMVKCCLDLWRWIDSWPKCCLRCGHNYVPSTWYQVFGTKYLVPCTLYQVLGTNIGTNILENRGGTRSAPPEDSSIYIYTYYKKLISSRGGHMWWTTTITWGPLGLLPRAGRPSSAGLALAPTSRWCPWGLCPGGCPVFFQCLYIYIYIYIIYIYILCFIYTFIYIYIYIYNLREFV